MRVKNIIVDKDRTWFQDAIYMIFISQFYNFSAVGLLHLPSSNVTNHPFLSMIFHDCPCFSIFSVKKNIKVLHSVLDFPLPCLITREFSLCPAKTRIKRPVRQPAATRAPVWSGHYGDLKSSTSYFFRL